jgi:hypothetical protein
MTPTRNVDDLPFQRLAARRRQGAPAAGGAPLRRGVSWSILCVVRGPEAGPCWRTDGVLERAAAQRHRAPAAGSMPAIRVT